MEMKEGKAKNIIFKTYCTRHSAMVCTNIIYMLYERAESREQRAESREQRAESREQRAESREQRERDQGKQTNK